MLTCSHCFWLCASFQKRLGAKRAKHLALLPDSNYSRDSPLHLKADRQAGDQVLQGFRV